MRQSEPKKLLKWNMMTTEEKERIMDEFWIDYFTKYPSNGSSAELNVMRAQFRDAGLIP